MMLQISPLPSHVLAKLPMPQPMDLQHEILNDAFASDSLNVG
jgi:hypothetical protein